MYMDFSEQPTETSSIESSGIQLEQMMHQVADVLGSKQYAVS